MSSGQLSRLETLSEKRADQTRLRVNEKRAELNQLERQRDELIAINQEYQKAPDTEKLVAPAMLAHRRAFVTRLAEQIEVLKTQEEHHKRQLDDHVQEHQVRTVQSAAIGALRESREREEIQASSRLEQRINDESGRSNRLVNASGEDHD